MGTALTLRDVVLSAGGAPVLAGTGFVASAGEVLAVAGEPGFGGSTLARAVAGLVRPDRGDVLLDGRSVLDDPPGLRKVGLVPAGGGLLPQLTAAQNIHYARRLGARSWYGERYVVERRVAGIVAGMGLSPVLDLHPGRLSAGQRLRVALARALARSPRVLVVDATAGMEPVFGLREVLDTAVAVWRDTVHAAAGPGARGPALAVLLCTSGPATVAAADRVIVLADGRLTADGAPAALRRAPASLAVARLVHPEGLAIMDAVWTGPDIVGPVRLPAPAGRVHFGRVRVVLTVDALTVHPGSGDLPGRVMAIRPGGPETRVLVAPEAAPTLRWLVTAPGGEPPRVGARVRVAVNPDKMIIFDAPGGAGPDRPLWPARGSTEAT